MPAAARGASQPTRTSSRETRPIERFRGQASQPVCRQRVALSPPPPREEPLAVPEPDPDLQQEVVDVAGYGRDAAADRIDLGPYTNAVVPGPLPGQFPEDAEGWSQIDGWGAYECAVSFTVPLEDVPGPFRNARGEKLYELASMPALIWEVFKGTVQAQP